MLVIGVNVRLNLAHLRTMFTGYMCTRQCLDLATLELDTLNPDFFISISNEDTFYFLLNPLFFSHNFSPCQFPTNKSSLI